MHVVGHKYMYRWHKVHHEWKVPHALSTTHSDPFDYFIGTVMPFAIGPAILGSQIHYLTFAYWSIWRMSEAFSNHCNYEFDWSVFRIVPISAGADYHSFHHTHNIGNYGSFMTLQDTLTDSNHEYYKYIGSRFVD